MDKSRLRHLLAFSRARPRLTWRDAPPLLAVAAVVWLWLGFGWSVMAWLWRVYN